MHELHTRLDRSHHSVQPRGRKPSIPWRRCSAATWSRRNPPVCFYFYSVSLLLPSSFHFFFFWVPFSSPPFFLPLPFFLGPFSSPLQFCSIFYFFPPPPSLFFFFFFFPLFFLQLFLFFFSSFRFLLSFFLLISLFHFLDEKVEIEWSKVGIWLIFKLPDVIKRTPSRLK